MWSNILLNEWRNELINDICFWSCIKWKDSGMRNYCTYHDVCPEMTMLSVATCQLADSLTCALGWVIWILWCLRHFEFQLWWCWWKLEEADRKGNSKHKKMGAMSLWTHSQMGLGIGALGVPELRRIPSGQLEPPRLLLKRGL